MGRTSTGWIGLALLDDVVRAVAADLEDREADATDDVAVRVEPDRLAEQRGLQVDLRQVAPGLVTRDLPVRTRERDGMRHRLHRDPGRGAERDRLAVLGLERRR